MNGLELANALKALLDQENTSEDLEDGDETRKRIAKGEIIPITRAMMAQIAEALSKCCVFCPLAKEKSPVETILSALEARTEEMDPKKAAEQYLLISEGNKQGNGKGTPLKQVQERIEAGEASKKEQQDAQEE